MEHELLTVNLGKGNLDNLVKSLFSSNERQTFDIVPTFIDSLGVIGKRMTLNSSIDNRKNVADDLLQKESHLTNGDSISFIAYFEDTSSEDLLLKYSLKFNEDSGKVFMTRSGNFYSGEFSKSEISDLVKDLSTLKILRTNKGEVLLSGDLKRVYGDSLSLEMLGFYNGKKKNLKEKQDSKVEDIDIFVQRLQPKGARYVTLCDDRLEKEFKDDQSYGLVSFSKKQNLPIRQLTIDMTKSNYTPSRPTSRGQETEFYGRDIKEYLRSKSMETLEWLKSRKLIEDYSSKKPRSMILNLRDFSRLESAIESLNLQAEKNDLPTVYFSPLSNSSSHAFVNEDDALDKYWAHPSFQGQDLNGNSYKTQIKLIKHLLSIKN